MITNTDCIHDDLRAEIDRLKELNREMVEAFIQCNHILATYACGMAYQPMYEIVSEALAKAEGVTNE